jgi:hypothetical protein
LIFNTCDYGWEAWTGLIWLRIGRGVPCEFGNELPGSLNAGNFFTSKRPVSSSSRTLLHAFHDILKLYIYIKLRVFATNDP